MAKATVRVTTVRTRTSSRASKPSSTSKSSGKGNQNRCPTCGRYR